MLKRKAPLAVLLIVFAGIILYANSLNSPFIYDDFHTFVENPYIKNPRHIPALFKFSLVQPSAVRPIYRPIPMLTFCLNYFFGGLNPWGYHLVNVILHILNAILVFALIYMLFNYHLGQGPLDSGYAISFFSGLLFLAHPVNSEAVNYISCRSELLAGFFMLGSFIFWIKSARQPKANFYYASLATFILGIFSKESAVVLPVVLIFFDLCFLKEKKGLLMRFKRYYWPYLAIILGYVLLRIYLLGHFLGNLYKIPVSRSLYENLLTQAKAVVFLYLKLLFIPLGLSIDHHLAISKSLFDTRVLFSLAIIIALFTFAMKLIKKQPLVTFFIAWFFIHLLPTGIIPLHIIANEHRLYLSSISFCFLLSLGLYGFLAGQARPNAQ